MKEDKNLGLKMTPYGVITICICMTISFELPQKSIAIFYKQWYLMNYIFFSELSTKAINIDIFEETIHLNLFGQPSYCVFS